MVSTSSLKNLSEILKKAQRVVVKIGTSVLINSRGRISHRSLLEIAKGISHLYHEKIRPVVVSSGAIPLGMQTLGLTKKPREMPKLQACAAIGQPILIEWYQKAFAPLRHRVGQILLTRSDFEDRTRFLNAKHTLSSLLDAGVIPIINENDTVAVEEIRVGDNDSLAALVTELIDADLLVLLTDQDGFHTADPRQHSGAVPIRVVEQLDEESFSRASDTQKATSVGGMRTKLEAVQKVAKLGIPTLIANGRDPQVLTKIFSGKEVGTLFLPGRRK